MEFIVKEQKRHIKHMFSGKSTKNINRRSAALCGLSDVSANFDKSTNVLIRATKHKEVSSLDDELLIITDLREIRPFSHIAGRRIDMGRKINDEKNMPCSGIVGLESIQFKNWLKAKHRYYTVEIGK
jgi:hypothetical protein